MKTFVPVFEKDDNRLFVTLEDFIAHTESEAMKIGYGAMFVEGLVLGMRFTGEVIEIDTKSVVHVCATLGALPVAIIGGPLFDIT